MDTETTSDWGRRDHDKETDIIGWESISYSILLEVEKSEINR